jgi:hypothetical protein
MISSISLKELLDLQFKGSGNIVIRCPDYRVKKFCREIETLISIKIKSPKEFIAIRKNSIPDLNEFKRLVSRYKYKYEIY